MDAERINEQQLISLLRCPDCGGEVVDTDREFLSCEKCLTRYPIRNGIPVMYAEGQSRTDLVYSSKVTSITHSGSRLRNLLRSINLEEGARRLLHAYISLDAKISPVSPADPAYWMDRVCSAMPRGPKTILDFGGGGGPYRNVLASTSDRYMILEVDYDSYSVQKNLDQHQYVIGDGESLLFSDNSFDVIAMFEVLEHVRNPFTILRNCGNWLKPGGILVLSAPQYWHLHGWPSDYFRYTIYGLKELVSSSGLQMVDWWSMGGPCVLIWCVVENNFRHFLRLPIVKQILSNPLLWGAKFGDSLLFSNNLALNHPDTRGWMVVAAKPETEGTRN